MPRPLRIEYPGAWHHVMNRGAAKRDIYLDVNDRLSFLELLGRSCARTEVEVHAYALMGNHFHLLVRTPNENLAEMMRLLSGVYARKFNDHYDRDGGLCRGRYKSIVVDSERYLLAVSRYIHRNPLAFWRRPLEAYPWSSYPSYLGLRKPQDWLETEETLKLAGGKNRYHGLVESPLASDVDRLYERAQLPTILGSAAFRDEAKRRGGLTPSGPKGYDPVSR